jgi:hypothetical protein
LSGAFSALSLPAGRLAKIADRLDAERMAMLWRIVLHDDLG